MWECESCKAKNKDDSKFCSSCGAERKVADNAVTAPSKKLNFVSESSKCIIPALILCLVGFVVNLIGYIVEIGNDNTLPWIIIAGLGVVGVAAATGVSFKDKGLAAKVLLITLVGVGFISSFFTILNDNSSGNTVYSFLCILPFSVVGLIGTILLFMDKNKAAFILLLVYSILLLIDGGKCYIENFSYYMEFGRPVYLILSFGTIFSIVGKVFLLVFIKSAFKKN